MKKENKNLSVDEEVFKEVCSYGKKKYISACITNAIAIILFMIGLFFCYVMAAVSFDTFTEQRMLKAEISELTKRKEVEEKAFSNRKPKEIDFEEIEKDISYQWDITENNKSIYVDNTELEINKNNVFVSDNADILSRKVRKNIYNLNKKMAEEQDGEQLMIITIDELPYGVSIKDFSQDVFQKLGIGQKGKNNGVLFLMAVNDRKTRIHTGSGMSEKISDTVASEILENDAAVESFRSKDYSEGVSWIVETLGSAMISKTPEIDRMIRQKQELKNDNKYTVIVGVVFTIIIFLIIFNMLKKSMKLKKALKKLVKNKNLEVEGPLCISKQSKESVGIELYYLYVFKPRMMLSYGYYEKIIKFAPVYLVIPVKSSVKFMGEYLLVGNALYNEKGRMVTGNYTASSYYHDNNSSSGGGGYDGGSFGGGSSDGGGASGGW